MQAEEIRKVGESLIDDASKIADLLAQYGADARRCFEPNQPDYHLQPKLCMSVGFVDCLAEVMAALTSRPRGRPPKKSTSDALILTDYFGMPKRRAASIIAKETGEPLDNIRKRLVALSKSRPRKTPSPKPGSPKPRSNKPR